MNDKYEASVDFKPDWKAQLRHELEGTNPPETFDFESTVDRTTVYLLSRDDLESDKTERDQKPTLVLPGSADPTRSHGPLQRRQRHRQRRLFRPLTLLPVAAVAVFAILFVQADRDKPKVEVLASQVTPQPTTIIEDPVEPPPLPFDLAVSAPTRDSMAIWAEELDADNYPAILVTWQGIDDRERLALAQAGADCVHLGTGHSIEETAKKASMTIGVPGEFQLVLVAAAPTETGCVEVSADRILARLVSVDEVEGSKPTP